MLMKCTICKTEVSRTVSLLIEYLHVHGEREDIIFEGTTLVDGLSQIKINNYCRFLESFVDTVDNLSGLTNNIKNIDITGKTYNQVRHELSTILKAWLKQN